MNEVEFRELVKVAAEKLKDNTVYQMLQSDVIYNQDSEKEGEAEQQYIELALTEEQRAVCDELLSCRGKQELEYSTAAYITGIYDAFRMMAVLFPEKWGLEEIRELLFNEE